MPGPVNAVVALRSAGVGMVLDCTQGRLPAILHWGADLGELTSADVLELRRAAQPAVGPNSVDEPVRLSVLPEHWTGWVGRPGLRGSATGRSWSPKFATTALRVEGVDVPPVEGPPSLVSRAAGRVEVEAADPVAELRLTLEVELTASGLARLRAELTNDSDAPYGVEDLVLALPVPAVGREILDLAGRWGKERVPQRMPLRTGTHLREGRKGRTGPDAATVLHLGTPGFDFAAGEIWAVHVGWSGNHTHYAERVWSGDQVIGGGELLLPGEIQLATGESYATPWLYASHGIGLDAVAARFHEFLRARPGHPSPTRPVTLNVWEAVYFDHNLERLLALADVAAAVGVERFVLDDGWFGSRRDDFSGLGDWVVSPEVWPNGLHPLVDRVRELGMQFGLWFEPEMVNLDSDVARAHPEWIMATGGRLPVESRHQQVINLGIPECYAFVRDAIAAVLDEYDIGYLKWDHNRDLVDAGTAPDGQPGVHEQTLAVYRLLDELHRAHPGLEIESCSSGGARVDLGILERTQRVWGSDCIDPHERQQIQRWTTQLIPLELVGAHIASGRSHTTGRIHDLAFRAATAVFGHLGIEWDLAEASAPELADLTAWIGFFKAHRELLFTGRLVRVDLPDPTLTATGVVARDRAAALFSYASLDGSPVVSPGRLRMPGLDPARRYRVRPPLIRSMVRQPIPPRWWGTPDDAAPSGIVLPGSALGMSGLMAADLDPDQAVLYLAEAVD